MLLIIGAELDDSISIEAHRVHGRRGNIFICLVFF